MPKTSRRKIGTKGAETYSRPEKTDLKEARNPAGRTTQDRIKRVRRKEQKGNPISSDLAWHNDCSRQVGNDDFQDHDVR